MDERPKLNAAVEGPVDAAVLRKLVWLAGGEIGRVHGLRGKGFLKKRIAAYNQAARYVPWVVLADYDGEEECPAAHRAVWVSDPAPLLCFRLAVHETESWLLADRENLATFLKVRVDRFPDKPDLEKDPKRRVVDLARDSRLSRIVRDLVPRRGSGRETGSGYTACMIEFVTQRWNPENARARSSSLHKCLRSLGELVIRARSFSRGAG